MGINYGPDGEVYGFDGRPMWYGLDGQPIGAAEAGALLRDANARRIGHAAITTDRGRVVVSTVFLALDHSFTHVGPPVLWETMTFGGPLDDETIRYSSAEAARAGHAEAVTHALTAIDLAGATVLAVENAVVKTETPDVR